MVLNDRSDRLIDDTPNVGNHTNVNDVKRGIDQLKPNKKDGHGILYTDHFINSNNMMRVYLALLLDSLVVHGFTPGDFNEATIFALVKNKRKSVNDSSVLRNIHSSTTKCTFSLMETVNYFRKNNSNVYMMLLDAQKRLTK